MHRKTLELTSAVELATSYLEHPEVTSIPFCVNAKTASERLKEACLSISSWRPMNTAPMDGRDVLLWCRDTNEQFVGYWHPKEGGWTYAQKDGVRFTCNPEAWLNLPNPPPL